MRRLLPVLVFLTLAGCASPVVQLYEGPTRAPSEQVILRSEARGRTFVGERIDIQQIDDRHTLSTGEGILSASTGAQAVYLLPGKHTVRARYRGKDTALTANLWFVGEPGGAYLLRAEKTGDAVKVFIEDEKTGKPTGGVRGSPDEPK